MRDSKADKAIRKAYDVERVHHASTGSDYYYVTDVNGVDAVIRVSNHGECYPPDRGERRIEWPCELPADLSTVPQYMPVYTEADREASRRWNQMMADRSALRAAYVPTDEDMAVWAQTSWSLGLARRSPERVAREIAAAAKAAGRKIPCNKFSAPWRVVMDKLMKVMPPRSAGRK